MKKIVFLTQCSGGGGAERVTTILANEFAEDNEVFYCYIRENGFYNLSDKVKKRCFGGVDALSQIKALADFFKRKNVDVVFAIGSPVATKVALAKMICRHKFRFIASERNDPAREITSGLKRKLRKWAYGKADAIVFQTEDAKNYYPERIRKKGVIILNPVTAKSEGKADMRDNNHRIIAAGRIDPQKNFTMLVKAFADFSKDFPQYTLDIFGRKSDESEYAKVVGEIMKNRLEEKVFLKGFTNDLYGEFLKSTIYVSSSGYEGISNSMLEALSAGLPCVCTDCPCGGARAIIENGVNGLLTPVSDADAFSEALKRLAGDEKLRETLSKNATSIRDTLSVEKIIKEWKALL